VVNADDVATLTIKPSNGSQNKRHFVAANGQRIPNMGEVSMRMKGENGNVTSTFQVAPVTRPLHSVSKMCDAGCEVKFTKGSGIVTKDGKTIATYQRVGGLYVAEFEATDRDSGGTADEPAPFTRQGAQR
jgi:hypothetical protein